MVNGYPTRTIIPFGEITKGASDITTSTDASEATTFTFTLRATDAQAQTADRIFTLTSSYGSTGGGQFN